MEREKGREREMERELYYPIFETTCSSRIGSPGGSKLEGPDCSCDCWITGALELLSLEKKSIHGIVPMQISQ